MGNRFEYLGPYVASDVISGSGLGGSVVLFRDTDFNISSIRVDDNHKNFGVMGNPPSTVNYSYNVDDLPIAVGNQTLAYHPQSSLLSGTALGTVADSYNYNGYGEALNYSATNNGANLYSASYTRDNAGRIVAKTETIAGVSNSYGYSYDLQGRLTSVTRNGVTVSTYSYDDNGNRISATVNGLSASGVYDDQDRMLSYGGNTYVYDLNGDLDAKINSDGTTTYHHDAFSNLRRVTLPSGRVIQYMIDGLGRRSVRRVDGVMRERFLYQSQLQVAGEIDSNGLLLSHFVYASKPNIPDYMIKGGVAYKIISDHLGSPRLVVNSATGEIVQRMDFDEFGRVLLDTNPGFQPFGFAGGLYDRDTGLVRFGARDYDPEVGRWTSKDPILFGGGDTNLYGYTFNDPINFIDPSGLAVGDWWDLSANYRRSREIANEEYANWSGHHNDYGDAMRHYEWSRRTTSETNSFTAFTAGWGHEIEYFFRRGNMPALQYLRESQMDLHNNALGRDSGRNGSLMCPSNLSTQPGSGY